VGWRVLLLLLLLVRTVDHRMSGVWAARLAVTRRVECVSASCVMQC
jgi:hypothetical protein